MPKDGNKTRLKILDKTQALILENGYAGTTIDQIIESVQITKGAFFYHFKSKADLARAVIEHYAKNDEEGLRVALEATEKFSADPVQRLLEFVQWFIDFFKELDTPFPGCLFASYTYEQGHFSEEVKKVVASSIISWRKAIVQLITEAEDASKTKLSVGTESLADHFTVIMEGAFIVSKSLKVPSIIAIQLVHYRNYLQLVFGQSILGREV